MTRYLLLSRWHVASVLLVHVARDHKHTVAEEKGKKGASKGIDVEPEV